MRVAAEKLLHHILLPFSKGDNHYWRFDYTYESKRKTLSIGVYSETGLALAREKADTARTSVARGEEIPVKGWSSVSKNLAQLTSALSQQALRHFWQHHESEDPQNL